MKRKIFKELTFTDREFVKFSLYSGYWLQISNGYMKIYPGPKPKGDDWFQLTSIKGYIVDRDDIEISIEITSVNTIPIHQKQDDPLIIDFGFRVLKRKEEIKHKRRTFLQSTPKVLLTGSLIPIRAPIDNQY